ncbi:MAG: sec-independent translocase [Arachnia sp.]
MLFGIDGAELIFIIVIAVIIFGPDKLPDFARKGARVFVYLRDIANNAKKTISTELGPEYADLELRDLHPKAFIAKQLRDEVALIEETKRELSSTTTMLKESAKEIESAAKLDDKDAASKAEPAPLPTPFDLEAT